MDGQFFSDFDNFSGKLNSQKYKHYFDILSSSTGGFKFDYFQNSQYNFHPIVQHYQVWFKCSNNNSVIKSVTKYACNNPMSVCSRNWSEFVCVNGVVTKSVKEIYIEWYGSVDVTIMDTVSVLNDMIYVRDGWGSCSILNTEDVNFIINDICIN